MGLRLKRFFFPAPDSPRWVRALPYVVLGALTLLVGVVLVYGWDYTNSPQFCGTACHTMPPEYTRYLTSPHARVDCVECHIGRGFLATKVTRKAGDMEHIVSLISKKYEFPIDAKKLQPARETCERCHSPEKFSTDSFREIKHFGNDVDNTPSSTYLIMHTGGGSRSQGLGRGTHWHIESDVYYWATSDDEQEIPFVRTITEDGTVAEYIDVEADVDPVAFGPGDLKRMDCINCHNRISHLILPPDDAVDELMTRGLVSPTIPEIRSRAVSALDAEYESKDAALDAIAGLLGFYEVKYPEFYQANADIISDAIQALQESYDQSVFPLQQETWATHPDNIGHEDSPGCFRCHDGKHFTSDGEAIRLECNLCHSVPVVAGPQRFVANIEISRGPEPESHRNSNWISLHRDIFDDSCVNCHTIEDPGGTSNQSFCSNSGCHGITWYFAGFDAPGLREILRQQMPTPAPVAVGEAPLNWTATIGPLLGGRCTSCHGESGVQGLDLTTLDTALAGGVGGPGVVPGDADASLVVQQLTGDVPHFAQLSPEELEALIEWIEVGAPRN